MDEAETAFDALCFEYGIELDDVVCIVIPNMYINKKLLGHGVCSNTSTLMSKA
jgi:hypothetical protein